MCIFELHVFLLYSLYIFQDTDAQRAAYETEIKTLRDKVRLHYIFLGFFSTQELYI